MKDVCYRYKVQILVLVAIIFIRMFFHYDIHIQDALSMEVADEYEIQISLVRIIFEPIVGLLLFFNRGLYPLEEFQIILYWLVILFVLRIVVKRFYQRKNVLKQLIYLPLIVGLWFTWFVITLFVPLPNNTIVNNSTNSILISTHSHTEFSHDGLISQLKMWEWQRYNGFDAFFITDHANHKKTSGLVERQRSNEFPLKPLVMVGEEYSASNHLSLLGLKNTFVTKGMNDSTVIGNVHKDGGVVLVNHWFIDKHNSMEFYNKLGVDGFEIENVGKELYYDRSFKKSLRKFCKDNELMMVGGLDFHGYGRACSIWNALEIPRWHTFDQKKKEQSILKLLKSGNQNRLKILMYKDRPYYENTNLLFRPFLTALNYFRTLDFYQILSWVIWSFFLVLLTKLIKIKRIKFINMLIALGVMSALFLLILGVNYYLKIDSLRGYTEMYDEYSKMLFYACVIFIPYISILSYYRFIKQKI